MKQEAEVAFPWGKLRDKASAHPLADHMLDVAACVHQLLLIPSFRHCAETLANRPLHPIDVWRLSALAFLHDLGKANAGFQAKRWAASDTSKPSAWPNPAGHVNEAWALFSQADLANVLTSTLPLEQMAAWGDSTTALLCAAIAHHGRPPLPAITANPWHLRQIWDSVRIDGHPVYCPTETLRDIGKKLTNWFAPAFDPGPPLPDAPAFGHWFAGLVQLADWLGSDIRFFPYSQPGEDRFQHIQQRAVNALQAIGLDASFNRQALRELPPFAATFGVPAPRPMQLAMENANMAPLLILESETGSGKTEAALWRFAQLFHAGKVDSLYFALPTRVAASQLYNRVRRFAQSLWQGADHPPPVVVRALAGYECADGNDNVRLPDFQVLWSDNPDDAKAHLRWAAESSKRFLGAPLAVGTIDQALLASLEVKHAHLRHSLLARSLLVVDEVHASDAYMSTLLAHLLQAHLAAGGHALLLSATLGSAARIRYQRILHPQLKAPTLKQACTQPYPALTNGAALSALANTGHNKTVHWRTVEALDKPDQVATLALNAARQGAKVLVIRNTVPAAMDTLRALEVQAQSQGLSHVLFQVRGVSSLHHSRFSREDRPLLDTAVEQLVGKDRTLHPQACVVVGTQTLEQSLDIDADLLITDLCPMDVLLQRVGRLHRHSRPMLDRPEGYRNAQAVVLLPAGQQLEAYIQRPRHGLGRFRQGGGVYVDLRVLEATRRLITEAPNHCIPQDNRLLVEQATHPDRLMEIARAGGAAWIEHGNAVDGETLAGRTQANLNTLPFDRPWVDGMGNVLTFAELDETVSTRLGASDHLLTFDPPQSGPFKQATRLLPLRSHLWPQGVPFDAPPTVTRALEGGGFEFMLGQQTFRYSRFGLERLKPARHTPLPTNTGAAS